MTGSFKGAARAAAGSIESAAGDILDRPDLQAGGAVKQAQGRAERTLGELEHEAADAAKRASGAAADIRDRAQGVYDEAADRLESISTRLVPFVREQPYVALGAAVAIGLLAGLLLAGRGSKVVYLRTPRS